MNGKQLSHNDLNDKQKLCLLISKGNYTRAVALGEVLLTSSPDDYDLNHNCAVALYKFAEYDKAVSYLERIINRKDAHWKTHYLIALVYRRQQEPESALHHFSQVLGTYPYFVPALYHRASLYYDMSLYDEAILDLKTILELDEEAALVYYNLAVVLIAKEMWDEALECLSRCIELNPKDSRMYSRVLVEIGKKQILSQVYSQGHKIKNRLGLLAEQMRLFSDETSVDIPEEIAQQYADIAYKIKSVFADMASFISVLKPEQIEYDVVNMNDLLQEILIILQNKLKLVRMTKVFDDDLPDIVCDPKLLKEAFINIIFNAVEAMTDGGELCISTGKNDDESIMILFADTGIGIKKENRNKVFTYGYTTKDFGSGLGLSLAKKFIDHHDGRILIDSNDPVGTVVTVTLPKDAAMEYNVQMLSPKSVLFEDPLKLLIYGEDNPQLVI